MIEHRKSRKMQVPEPSEQLTWMLDWASRSARIRVKPQHTAGPWRLGFACVTGPVRAKNEDYALCFSVNEHDVLVAADGCGGMDHGQYASYVAASAAAVKLVGIYGSDPKSLPDPQAAASIAVRAASSQLSVEADRSGITDFSAGMRTTLIVVVANRDEVGYAYIGDGGACVVRSSGETMSFLEPQKADGMANVLSGSLGPEIQGDPVAGRFPRRPGDLVIVGTDGVFDRVQATFPNEIARLAALKQGDLTRVAQEVLRDFGSIKDDLGFVCDDNMSLLILGDGRPPVSA